MRKIARHFLNTFFGENLDLSVQVFHLLGFIGVILGLLNGFSEMMTELRAPHIILNLSASIFAILLLYFAKRTGRYRICSIITIITVFLIAFPILYFTGDGYLGTLPMFFLLAFLFTALMLDGWQRIAFLLFEFAVYVSSFIIEQRVFGQLAAYSSSFENMSELLLGFVCVAIALIIILTIYIRMYNRQRHKLDKQNVVLAEASRAKTEFLQDIGHEIRNPLQVISYGVDFMRDRIAPEGGAEETLGALNAIQEEAVRLGLMINGMVELATMSGNSASRVKMDFAAMLRRAAETFRIEAERKHNALCVEIGSDLPPVYAVAEQLERMPINLLRNAMNATEGGVIYLEAFLAAAGVTVKIRDNGTGIAPELLPRVFERGVSGRSGKGYGLSICKTIVEAHSGVIEIESEPGKGTTVTFIIPVYGGQSEVREHE